VSSAACLGGAYRQLSVGSLTSCQRTCRRSAKSKAVTVPPAGNTSKTIEHEERSSALRRTRKAAWIWRIGAHHAHEYRSLDHSRRIDRNRANRMHHDEAEEEARSVTARPLRRILGSVQHVFCAPIMSRNFFAPPFWHSFRMFSRTMSWEFLGDLFLSVPWVRRACSAWHVLPQRQ
jgi:hypothetical protein